VKKLKRRKTPVARGRATREGAAPRGARSSGVIGPGPRRFASSAERLARARDLLRELMQTTRDAAETRDDQVLGYLESALESLADYAANPSNLRMRAEADASPFRRRKREG